MKHLLHIIRKLLSNLFGFLSKKKVSRILFYSGLIFLSIFLIYKRVNKNRPEGGSTSFLQKLFRIGNAEEKNASNETQGLKSVRIVPEEVTPSFSIAGSIEYIEKVEIFPKISGRIETIFVTEGKEVSRNQKLVKIESLPYEIEILKQRATVDSAKSQWRLAQEKYLKARRNFEGRFKDIDKQEALLRKTREEFERVSQTLKGKESLFEKGGISREELENARVDMISKESAWTVSKKDFEIVNLGMRDEDISRAGYKIPKKKEEKEKVLREINTKIEKAEMEVAEGTVKSHESQMEATRILLKECTLYSPMDGVVARKYKSRGEMINGGAGQSSQAILTLVYMDEVYGVFNIPEQDSPVIKNRMKVNFTADIFPEKVFSGSIVQVSPLIDPKTHTVEVKAVIPNNKKKLKPGMFIRANIVTGEPENMILLQNTALLPKEGDSAFVFVIRENQVFKAEVKTGKKYGEKLEIKEGLREGDVVVLEKISQLREGIKALPLF